MPAMFLWPFDLLLDLFEAFWTGNSDVVVHTASARDTRRLAEIHAASFHRGWSEDEFDRMLVERNTLVQALRMGSNVIGFAISRVGADEAEILSIAIDSAHRGRGLSGKLLLTHLGHLAGRGVKTVFLEVEENNRPARRLYERTGFAVVRRRERYYRQASGEQLNALLMRRDLS
jgi:[ribosomal protein S18]-alanine N-acetyltransferase